MRAATAAAASTPSTRRPRATLELRLFHKRALFYSRSCGCGCGCGCGCCTGVHVAEGGLMSITPQGRRVPGHPDCGMSKCTAAFGACQASGAT